MSALPHVGLPKPSGRKSELRAQDRDRKDIEDADLPAADYDIPSTLEALSDDELYELSQHEVVIQRGLKTFVEVGEALMAIREGRLYRQTYHTFEEYCQQRWQLGRNYVNKVILAANVVENLGTNVPILPTNESQVRPLTKLGTPEEQQAAWTEAVMRSPNGKPTGAIVAAVVDAMKNPHPLAPSPLRPTGMLRNSEGEQKAHAGEPPVMEPPQKAAQEEMPFRVGQFVQPKGKPVYRGVMHGVVHSTGQVIVGAPGQDTYDRYCKLTTWDADQLEACDYQLPDAQVAFLKALAAGEPVVRNAATRMALRGWGLINGESDWEKVGLYLCGRGWLDVYGETPDEAVDDYVPEVEEVQVEAAGGVVLTVGATVWTPSGHEGKVVSITGRYATVLTVNGARQYEIAKLMVTGDEDDEEVPTSEFQVPSEETPAVPAQSAAPNHKLDAKRTFPADETVSQPFDFCQTPPYAVEPLLPYLGWSMPSTIWEPAYGEGLLVQALFDGGWTREHVVTSDIRTEQNFFEYEPAQWDIIVTNPPYSLKYRWLERCYELGKPFALLLPVESLGAKAAQDLMQQYGFEMMLLDTRVNFKMPNKGWDGSSPFPTFWLTWHLLPEKVMFGSISEGKRAFNERL